MGRESVGTGEHGVGAALERLHLDRRAAAACNVPPVARGNARGAAVVWDDGR